MSAKLKEPCSRKGKYRKCHRGQQVHMLNRAASWTVQGPRAREETTWTGVLVHSPLARMCAAPALGKRAILPHRPMQHKDIRDLALLSIFWACQKNLRISFPRPCFLLQGVAHAVRCLVVPCLPRQCLRPISRPHTVCLFCSIRQEG